MTDKPVTAVSERRHSTGYYTEGGVTTVFRDGHQIDQYETAISKDGWFATATRRPIWNTLIVAGWFPNGHMEMFTYRKMHEKYKFTHWRHAPPPPLEFSGAGTTGLVATRLGRNYVGIELNAEYIAMSSNRITGDAPMFNSVEVVLGGEQ